MDDVALTSWALLPLHQPFLQTVRVEDVLADRDLQEPVRLLKIVQTHTALLLQRHRTELCRYGLLIVGEVPIANRLHRS